MAITKPTIYPTLVIGLGGTGTNVVRYVKRRFQRTWNGDDMEDLPLVLQLLSVDTEPLINTPGEEPLYFHEFAFLGKYDATRLIQNKANHPSLGWWNWDNDIPLGYIHNGAKQLRPIGRLSFFRNYPTFKNMLTDKLNAMQELPAIQEAQERDFAVASDFRLIYIVSSLCGGTGAGMFLDVAHVVRHYVGSNAHIVGIFMMPSVFEKDVRSDLQRRRIQANAYAALKEINHFHTTQGFEALYPSEQVPIPTTRHRAFSQIMLVERNNAGGKTLSSKQSAEQMAAHLIHLTAFSHVNKRILGLDVNVTEERSNQGTSFLSYSSFAVSSLVMPQTALRRYIINRLTFDTLNMLLPSQEGMFDIDEAHREYLDLRQDIGDEFMKYAGNVATLKNLSTDISQKDRLWLGFDQLITSKLEEIFKDKGIDALSYVVHRLSLSEQGANNNELTRDDLGHREFRPFQRSGARPVKESFMEMLSSSSERKRRQAERGRAELDEHRERVWAEIVGAVQNLAQGWEKSIADLTSDIYGAIEEADKSIQQAEEDIHPNRRNSDREMNTLYDMETGAIGKHELQEYWDQVHSMLLDSPISEEGNRTPWDILLSSLRKYILPAGLGQIALVGSGQLRYAVENAVEGSAELQAVCDKALDIRNMVYLQHRQPTRPTNSRIDQLFQRLAPYAAVDGDTHPYSEAVQEHTRLVSTPTELGEDSSDVGRVFRQSMRGYGQFEAVKSGDAFRIDACHIVHGLPLSQLSTIPEMHRQYWGADFSRRTLHLQPEWEGIAEIYYPPPSYTAGNGHSNGNGKGYRDTQGDTYDNSQAAAGTGHAPMGGVDPYSRGGPGANPGPTTYPGSPGGPGRFGGSGGPANPPDTGSGGRPQI